MDERHRQTQDRDVTLVASADVSVSMSVCLSCLLGYPSACLPVVGDSEYGHHIVVIVVVVVVVRIVNVVVVVTRHETDVDELLVITTKTTIEQAEG